MLDSHLVPYQNWGIKPILFDIFGFSVPSYSLFVFLGIVLGVLVYWSEVKKKKNYSENNLYILLAALLGGAIGAKLVIIVIYWNELTWEIILYGKSIVGGLIGGTIGVLLAKKFLGIEKERKGNFFAPAIALGVAVGRIGCFLRGCCYGKETFLPWGIDFGDGVSRHPTQLYESLFMLGMFFYLRKRNKKNPSPGSSFDILIISYFGFRFLIEFIRVEKIIFLG
ncbi:MAG: prolipoprotein diacylglyceryl transferase [Candidatus Pacearchaeota archaeon]